MFHNPNPGFFQPLIPGFESNFSIPKAFNKYLEEEKEGKKFVTLRDKGGKIWEIKVDNNNDDQKLRFKEGWNKFCEENELEIGDFLVFKHVGNWVFDVFIFDHTNCERQLPLFEPPTSNYSTQEKKEMMESLQGHNCCHLIVKPYSVRYSHLKLPIKFARENGLNKVVDGTMVDKKGRRWPLNIRVSYDYPYIKSWASARITLNLKPGDPIILEVIQSGKNPILKLHVL
ncbi:hypothetical protein RND81_05G124000 [Saponaria officinalis]|uniref:TF-B3 domain-containing protein n=1 Tax=Saponaria officinalis TaxID=3572 RepID=A0AAW1KWQ6_SAPOF